MAQRTWSWGNYPPVDQNVIHIPWRNHNLDLSSETTTVLPYGNGRSYGDVALNDGGSIIQTQQLNHLISFDTSTGVICCEAGTLLTDIIQAGLPKGWFLPVTPGTQYVTIAGALANDVHGKNHYSSGTLGNHVLSFDLLRSDGTLYHCSPQTNHDLFKASIGGLGLTGLITTVTLQLQAVNSDCMDVENIPFANIDEGLELFSNHESSSTYSVAWIDCLATGAQLGRGILTLGEHSSNSSKCHKPTKKLSVPFNFPGFALNKWSVKAFNTLYYSRGAAKHGTGTTDLYSYFYPLDSLLNWNRIYGRQGFFQHQSVIPISSDYSHLKTIRKMLNTIANSGNASFLVVLKTFGDKRSPGMLSFPRRGITLALDFPNKGPATLELLSQLDEMTISAGGRIYPAKDARMSADTFQQGFPEWQQFSTYIDPKFSSSFWRRVTG